MNEYLKGNHKEDRRFRRRRHHSRGEDVFYLLYLLYLLVESENSGRFVLV